MTACNTPSMRADAGLPTVEECDEQVLDAQYVLDHPDEYDPAVRVQASRSLGIWKMYREYAIRLRELEKQIETARECCARPRGVCLP